MIKATSSLSGRTVLPAGMIFCVAFSTVRADTIPQTVSNIDWNAAMWGTPESAPTAGNDYVSTAGLANEAFRISANGASSTFPGDSITVSPATRALMKLQNGAVASMAGDFILAGGRLSFGPNGGPHTGTLQIGNLIVTGTGSFIDPSSAVTTLTLDGTLTGSGDLLLKPENGGNTKTIVFTDVSAFTGPLTVQATIRVDFNVDYTFSNSFILESTAILNVDQTLTFDEGDLVANGVVVPPGTYSGTSLFDLGPNFEDNGGTVIVNFVDSDADGLSDYFEDLIINFDPEDDVVDYTDVAGPNDFPTTTDFDGDGRTDADEYANGVAEDQTDPTDPDSDDDGLLDGPEVAGTDNNSVSTGFGPTDPNNTNSDGDGFDDFTEVRYGSNPNSDLSEPGDVAPIINGGFEEPLITNLSEGVSVASGSVPGWSVLVNDFYVIDFFSTNDPTNPAVAAEEFQFATAARNAPEPDVDPSAYVGGNDASLSMQQLVDVSSLATQIDGGVSTFILDFSIFDNDSADQGVVTLEFLDASDTELGRSSEFRSGNFGGAWVERRQLGFPPVGTRKVRLKVEAIKNAVNGTSVRNIHYDDFRGRLVEFDADMDGLPDGWEALYGLDSDDSGDAAISSDPDTLTNLQEFQLGTNPTLADTDGDGINDDVEFANGTDPLDPNSPVPDVSIDDIILTKDGTGAVTQVEIIASGLVVDKTYTLMRGTDLNSFTVTVDTYQATATTESFFDFSPPAGTTSSKAFYRLED